MHYLTCRLWLARRIHASVVFMWVWVCCGLLALSRCILPTAKVSAQNPREHFVILLLSLRCHQEVQVMRVWVHISSDETIAVDVKRSTRISELELEVCERSGVSASHACIAFDECELEGSCRVSDFQIQDGAILVLKRKDPKTKKLGAPCGANDSGVVFTDTAWKAATSDMAHLHFVGGPAAPSRKDARPYSGRLRPDAVAFVGHMSEAVLGELIVKAHVLAKKAGRISLDDVDNAADALRVQPLSRWCSSFEVRRKGKDAFTDGKLRAMSAALTRKEVSSEAKAKLLQTMLWFANCIVTDALETQLASKRFPLGSDILIDEGSVAAACEKVFGRKLFGPVPWVHEREQRRTANQKKNDARMARLAASNAPPADGATSERGHPGADTECRSSKRTLKLRRRRPSGEGTANLPDAVHVCEACLAESNEAYVSGTPVRARCDVRSGSSTCSGCGIRICMVEHGTVSWSLVFCDSCEPSSLDSAAGRNFADNVLAECASLKSGPSPDTSGEGAPDGKPLLALARCQLVLGGCGYSGPVSAAAGVSALRCPSCSRMISLEFPGLSDDDSDSSEGGAGQAAPAAAPVVPAPLDGDQLAEPTGLPMRAPPSLTPVVVHCGCEPGDDHAAINRQLNDSSAFRAGSNGQIQSVVDAPAADPQLLLQASALACGELVSVDAVCDAGANADLSGSGPGSSAGVGQCVRSVAAAVVSAALGEDQLGEPTGLPRPGPLPLARAVASGDGAPDVSRAASDCQTNSGAVLHLGSKGPAHSSSEARAAEARSGLQVPATVHEELRSGNAGGGACVDSVDAESSGDDTDSSSCELVSHMHSQYVEDAGVWRMAGAGVPCDGPGAELLRRHKAIAKQECWDAGDDCHGLARCLLAGLNIEKWSSVCRAEGGGPLEKEQLELEQSELDCLYGELQEVVVIAEAGAAASAVVSREVAPALRDVAAGFAYPAACLYPFYAVANRGRIALKSLAVSDAPWEAYGPPDWPVTLWVVWRKAGAALQFSILAADPDASVAVEQQAGLIEAISAALGAASSALRSKTQARTSKDVRASAIAARRCGADAVDATQRRDNIVAAFLLLMACPRSDYVAAVFCSKAWAAMMQPVLKEVRRQDSVLSKLSRYETNLIFGNQNSDTLMGKVVNNYGPYTRFGSTSCVSIQLVWASGILRPMVSDDAVGRAARSRAYIASIVDAAMSRHACILHCIIKGAWLHSSYLLDACKVDVDTGLRGDGAAPGQRYVFPSEIQEFARQWAASVDQCPAWIAAISELAVVQLNGFGPLALPDAFGLVDAGPEPSACTS